MMKRIDRQTLARNAATIWKARYWKKNGGWSSHNVKPNKTTSHIHLELLALGIKPNPDDVDRVIGNRYWTEVPDCDECGEKTEFVIQVGEALDYDSRIAHLCHGCLKKALQLV